MLSRRTPKTIYINKTTQLVVSNIGSGTKHFSRVVIRLEVDNDTLEFEHSIFLRENQVRKLIGQLQDNLKQL